MKLSISKEQVEELKNNKFFQNKMKEFRIDQDSGLFEEFLSENPDFMQMVHNQASKISIVDD